MSFDEKLAHHKKLDHKQAKNLQDYERMVAVLSRSEDKDQLKQMSLLYILDMNYHRADICLALHTVEMAKGWH